MTDGWVLTPRIHPRILLNRKTLSGLPNVRIIDGLPVLPRATRADSFGLNSSSLPYFEDCVPRFMD